MPIRARCWKCGKVVKAGDDWAGKSGKCPNCNAPIAFVDEPAQDASVVPASQPASSTPASIAPDGFAAIDVRPPRAQGAIQVVAVERKPVDRRNVVKYWPLVATACVSVLVGYFVGREHLKWEMRKALLSFGDSMRETFAPSNPRVATSQPDGQQRNPEPPAIVTQSDALKIESIDSRVTESNASWQKHAWILVIRNEGSESYTANATIEWMDADGFVIDDDSEYGLTIGPGESKTFRGYDLISVPEASKVTNVSAKIQY
jgi:hypothetical protein